MERNKCLGTLSTALLVVVATLAWASGAAGSQLEGEPDAAGAYNVLHLFTWAKYPIGNLIFDKAGNLYGTTFDGGGSGCYGFGCGVVWKLGRNLKGNWTVSILHTFTGGADGGNPKGGLIFDAAGNLYGTTSTGGVSGMGVVFKLKPNPDRTWTESVLHTFTAHGDGDGPNTALTWDAAGNLYGATGEICSPCAPQGATVFRLAPNPDGTWTYSSLYVFTGGADGNIANDGLIFDAAGNLYGTTEGGGDLSACGPGIGCGVVFKLKPNPDGTWTESVLHTFGETADGAQPSAGLIFDAAGNLYGTTTAGGYCASTHTVGCGVVFQVSPKGDGTWSESVLYYFSGGADGASPYSGLVFDAAGNLYGTTSTGGATPASCYVETSPLSGCGVVFKLEPSSTPLERDSAPQFCRLRKVSVFPSDFRPGGQSLRYHIGGQR